MSAASPLPALRFAPGDAITQRGAEGRRLAYTFENAEPCTRTNGLPSAPCAICGAGFTTRSGRRPRALVRTCAVHRGTWHKDGARV